MDEGFETQFDGPDPEAIARLVELVLGVFKKKPMAGSNFGREELLKFRVREEGKQGIVGGRLEQQGIVAQGVVEVVGHNFMGLVGDREEQTSLFDGMGPGSVAELALALEKVVKLELRRGMGVATAMPLDHLLLFHLEHEYDIEDLHGLEIEYIRRMRTFATLLLVMLSALPALAQDTRGSLVPDARVFLPNGTSLEVSDVRVGTLVQSWKDGKALSVKVTAIRRGNADSFIEVRAGGQDLQATGSHRIALADKTLVRLDTVKKGDKVLVVGPSGPVEAVVTQVKTFPATLVAYDLTIEGHQTFVVAGFVVGD